MQVVLALLAQGGYSQTPDLDAADVVLVNTCAIRENAEQRIWQRLDVFKRLKADRQRAAKRAAKLSRQLGLQPAGAAAAPPSGQCCSCCLNSTLKQPLCIIWRHRLRLHSEAKK